MAGVYLGHIRKMPRKKEVYAVLEPVEAPSAWRLLFGINRRIKLEMEDVNCMAVFQLARKLKQEKRP